MTENRDGSSARIMALDTVILDPVTLAPRRHTSHNSVRAVSIRYEGERVLGTITNRAGAVSAVDTTLASPGFDQGTIDVVLSTLPLEAGARWVLPVVELQRLTWQPVSVTEVPLEIDGRTIDRTWRVVVGEDRGQSVYWFDAADRRLLRRELIIAPTMVIRHDVRS